MKLIQKQCWIAARSLRGRHGMKLVTVTTAFWKQKRTGIRVSIALKPRVFSWFSQKFARSMKLDSMRWFSHRRSPTPRAARNGIVCCCVLRMAQLRRTPYCALSMGMTQQFFFRFLSLVTSTFDLDLRTRATLLYIVPNRQVWSSYV